MKYFWVMLLLSKLVFATDMNDFLVRGESPSVVNFVLMNYLQKSINGIHVSYLNSEDCYSGYIGGFKFDKAKVAFEAEEIKVFRLSATKIFDEAGAYDKQQIHSILVRLLVEGQGYARFAWFYGGCQDQEINCCVPVSCDENSGVCLPTRLTENQPIFWL